MVTVGSRPMTEAERLRFACIRPDMGTYAVLGGVLAAVGCLAAVVVVHVPTALVAWVRDRPTTYWPLAIAAGTVCAWVLVIGLRGVREDLAWRRGQRER